jgi:hypothetical protein
MAHCIAPIKDGFIHKSDTGTCILEAKLCIQFFIPDLFYLSKAYDKLDCKCIMLLMEAYGIGPHTQLIIKALCKHKLMVPKSGDCFGKQLHPIHGI